MTRRQPHDEGSPWPQKDGALPQFRAGEESLDVSAQRRLQLTAARDLMATALVVLDEHSRSQAAAMVDMAIHLVNLEIGT